MPKVPSPITTKIRRNSKERTKHRHSRSPPPPQDRHRRAQQERPRRGSSSQVVDQEDPKRSGAAAAKQDQPNSGSGATMETQQQAGANTRLPVLPGCDSQYGLGLKWPRQKNTCQQLVQMSQNAIHERLRISHIFYITFLHLQYFSLNLRIS